MDLVVLRAATDSVAARQLLALPAGAVWARFGDDLVVGGVGAAWSSHRAALSPTAVLTAPDAARERLHVVVQTGRTFEQHHPEVRVLHDRGRYLLVELDPRLARRIGRQHPACYSLRPLGAGAEVFAHGGAVAPREADTRIQDLVDAVSRDRFAADLAWLAAIHSRLSTGTGFRNALARARTELAALGYETRRQRITVRGETSYNLIADRPGNGTAPRRRVYVTAHLDSINHLQGAAGAAPGADDNGSGSAGVLEMARVFAGASAAQDLRFVLFGGEEQGLFGSQQLVGKLGASERARIAGVVNMDMIASTNTPRRTVLLEGAPASSSLIDDLEGAAATYTDLAVERSLNASNSDHVPFLSAGIPAVLTIESADSSNGRVHTASDTLEHVDHDLAVEILRMNVACVAAAIALA